jgi:hypothetical protein
MKPVSFLIALSFLPFLGRGVMATSRPFQHGF